ncbi:MAG: transposase [Spirochaetales bacterium]|nr:transposase [Spirochaetales bacterium]
MGKKRNNYDKAFKARVALEALRNESTIQELSMKYDIHQNQIIRWKKQLEKNSADIFERANKKVAYEQKAEKDYEEATKTIGKLTIENEFLKKKYKQLYGKEPF